MKARRTKKSAVARVRPFWILIILLLIAATVGGYYGAAWPGFRVRAIAIAGNAVVTKTDILHRAAIDGAQNIWLQNMGSAAERIRAIPYVKDVHIHRRLPAHLSIEITERKPYAVVGTAGQTMLVDGDLRVLEADGARTGLPFFITPVLKTRPGDFLRDQRLAAIARDYQTLQAAHISPVSLRFDKLDDLTVVIQPGITLKLGDDADLAEKAGLVDPILSQTQEQGRHVQTLDLRAPKTPVVVFKQ